MEIKPIEVKESHELKPGTLFYLTTGVAKSFLGMAAVRPVAGGTQRTIVPLSFPGTPEYVGTIIDVEAMSGTAAIIDNVTATVLPNSLVSGSYGGASGDTLIYSDATDLFLPLHDGNNFRRGFLRLSDGEIVNNLNRPTAGFAAWRIVETDDNSEIVAEFGTKVVNEEKDD